MKPTGLGGGREREGEGEGECRVSLAFLGVGEEGGGSVRGRCLRAVAEARRPWVDEDGSKTLPMTMAEATFTDGGTGSDIRVPVQFGFQEKELREDSELALT